MNYPGHFAVALLLFYIVMLHASGNPYVPGRMHLIFTCTYGFSVSYFFSFSR